MKTDTNLYSQFEKRFAGSDAVFLQSPDGATLTYKELPGRVAQISNYLVAQGAKPGDRIAAQVEKSATAILLYLACLRAGCVYLPLNPAYQAHELRHLLGDAKPTVVVVAPKLASVVKELAGAGCVVIELGDDGWGELTDAASNQVDSFETVERVETDLAAILYTSGTTGLPKGAMLSHGNLLAGVKTLHTYWWFKPGDVLLHILPIFHFHGLFVAVHCALWNASKVFFETRFDVQRVMSLLDKSTVMMGVPTHYVRLLSDPELDWAACSSMRLFISGSAPLLSETFTAFKARTGHTILERYGMTEGGMFTSNPYQGPRKCGTVGLALPGLDVRVVSEGGLPLASGETGAIEVRGPNVFRGYWQLPEKTASEFTVDGYFKTGDVGQFDDEGYLSIVGRNKDLIISGGLNVYPKEIEELLDGLEGVQESAVIGVPDPDFGEAVVGIIVPTSVDGELDSQIIIDQVKTQLAKFKVPKAIHFVGELPRNAMGKVQKNLLRAQFAQKV
ncbi:MAG: AMP-binding protein [Pseudomonadota bacterium]